MEKTTSLMTEIKQIKIKHPRASDFMAKISRHDDCFGMMFDEKSDDCTRCVMKCDYKGKEYTMSELCKIVMKIPIVEEGNNLKQGEEVMSETNENTATEEKTAEAPVEKKTKKEKKAPAVKKEAPAKKEKKAEKKAESSEPKVGKREVIILDLLKKKEMSQGDLVEKMQIRGSTTNIALRKMLESGSIIRREEGRGFIYGLSTK